MSDLRRRLATARGWTEIEDYQYWYEGSEGSGTCNTLRGLPPDTPDDGWEYMHMIIVPDYANDDSACLDALEALPSDCIPSLRRTIAPFDHASFMWSCEIVCPAVTWYELGATRREAMVKALCAFYSIDYDAKQEGV